MRMSKSLTLKQNKKAKTHGLTWTSLVVDALFDDQSLNQ